MDSFVLIIFFSVVVILGAGLLFVISKRSKKKSLDRERYQTDWQSIELAVGDSNSSMQFAILQADKLLDRALKESGYKGKTMGERMTSASRAFSKPDATWSAHKLRNRIAHEHDVVVSKKLTGRALVCFKRALKDLGAL